MSILDNWERDHPLGMWKESTEEDFYYSLEVLPPMHWRTINGVESFKVSEPVDHRKGHPFGTYTCCARIGDKYYVSYQGHSATAAEIATQVHAFANKTISSP